ncbi:galactose-binding domain-like protein, partial [Globomyces pollinis-pini]
PDLNWRDAQRLSIENALVVNAKDADWKANGAKRPFNHKYGYGTYDTWKIIEAAKTFVSVNPQVSVSVPSGSIGLPIPQTDEGLINRIKIDQALIDGVGLKRLEHVSVTVNIEHQNRGDVAIYLKSPDQFVSRLIESRRLDDSTSGFPNWTMMSVAHWDETPVGEWEISIIDKVNPDKTGTFKDWTLTLWGESASSAPKESIPSSTLSTIQSTTTTVSKPTATSVASSTIIVSSLPNGSSGSTTDHIASNTPVVLFTIMVFSMLIMIGVYIYRNGLVKKKDYEFEQLDDFDDNDFDVLALNDLESARNDVLFEVNDNQP